MHIDADAFFASVEQGFNPLLRDKPVIVGGSENQRGVVHTASYEARARGVRTGMALMEAKRVCPDATFLKGDFQHYRAASQIMQEIYLKYTPMVEFTSLDDAYLDLSGTQHIYHSPALLAKQIQADVFRELHFGVSLGVGVNKVVARIASGLQKPRGIVYVPPGTERQFLAPLAVDHLPGVGRVSKEKLMDLGIFSIGQLAALPKLILSDIFGQNGLKMWEMANGVDPRKVVEKILPKQISRETTFEEDTTDLAAVMATLQYLTERISAKLREQKLLCKRVSIKIRYSDFTQHIAAHAIRHSTDNAADIFDELGHIFQRLPLRRLRIRHVGVAVSQLEWRDFQMRLFNEETRLELLDNAVDEIREKFGFMAILPADTLELRKKYRIEKNGYVLHSPALTK